MKVTQSCPTLCNSMDYTVHAWNSPDHNTGVGSLSLLQGIFPTQGSNPGLPHCRQIIFQLRHQGSPRMLEWAACSFSSRSSRPRHRTGVSHIAGSYQGSPLSKKTQQIDLMLESPSLCGVTGLPWTAVWVQESQVENATERIH